MKNVQQLMVIILLFCSSVVLADDESPFVGNWTETFNVSGGTVQHTPTFVNLNGIRVGNRLYLSLNSSINGVKPTKCPVELKVNMTREEFKKQLECI